MSNTLYLIIRIIYGIYDSISYRSPPPENHQYITTDDFFKKLLKSNRTAFGDAILNLIEIKYPETLSFGEYVDCICAFCLFEEDDVLKLAFKMFDPEKSGFVDKDELRFFIYSQHDDDQGANIERGLKYLEDNDDGDGRFEFYQIDLRCALNMQIVPSIQKAKQTDHGDDLYLLALGKVRP